MTGTPQLPSSIEQDGDIDFRALFGVLWAGKWLIGAVTIAAAVIAVIVVLMLPNIYRAEALLAPNSSEGAGGLSALAAQYGGLATLAGINLGDSSTDKIAVGLEVLKSRKFLSEFIERHEILVPLMAAKSWDAESGSLVIDPDAYDESSRTWVREVRRPKSPIPSRQEAYEKFEDILSVSQNNKNGFVTVAIEHYSPHVAKQWVDWLIEDLNRSTMRRDVAEAQQAIDYLNKQIEKTPVADLQKVFVSLIEEQTKTVMLAEVSDEYLLKTLDPAVVPELKARPKRALIVLLVTLLGGFLGILIQLFWFGFAAADSSKGDSGTPVKES